MKKAVAFLVILSFFACGKKGPLLPPLVRAPQKAEGVAVAQSGAKILITWKNPLRYTDGTDLVSAPAVEIWVLEQPKAVAPPAAVSPGVPAPEKGTPGGKPKPDRPGPRTKVSAKDFGSKAKLAVTLAGDRMAEYLTDKGNAAGGFTYAYPLSGKKPGDTALLFSLRIKDSRGRASEFSEPAAIEPGIVPLPPDGLEAATVEEGVALSWKAPAANIDGTAPAAVSGYRIFRRVKDGPPVLANEKPVKELRYVDHKAEMGVPLSYVVRAATAEAGPLRESEDSAPVEIVARDTFPPAPPKGTMPVVGRGFIALSWEANTEKDLAGYRIRRREEGAGESVLLTAGPIIENAFQDTTVAPGRRYQYLLTAVDGAGNESRPTEITVESLKDGCP